jgi:hypothetical protein
MITNKAIRLILQNLPQEICQRREILKDTLALIPETDAQHAEVATLLKTLQLHEAKQTELAFSCVAS